MLILIYLHSSLIRVRRMIPLFTFMAGRICVPLLMDDTADQQLIENSPSISIVLCKSSLVVRLIALSYIRQFVGVGTRGFNYQPFAYTVRSLCHQADELLYQLIDNGLSLPLSFINMYIFTCTYL